MDHQQVYCGSQWAMAEGGNSIEHRVYIESATRYPSTSYLFGTSTEAYGQCT